MNYSKGKEKLIRGLVVLILVISSSCYYWQSYYSGSISKRARYTAVIPFVNLTSYPYAGRIVSEFVTTECYSILGVKLMDTTVVLSRLKAENEDIDNIFKRKDILRISKELGVDTIMYGTVTEFRYKRGLSEDPVVGITIRVFDVPSGKIIWTGSKSGSGGCLWLCEDSLSRLAQNICHELVVEMAKHL